MPKGPPVHEIFNQPMPGINKTSGFHFEKKETKVQTQLSHKKTLAPLPPMKKFGGYKPKILGGTDSFIPISSSQPDPPPPADNDNKTRRPAPVLSKPKPFIIGDKNTPMVFSTADDDIESINDNSDLARRMEDAHIYEEPVYRHNGDNYNVEVNNNELSLNSNNNNNNNVSFSTHQVLNNNTRNQHNINNNKNDNIIFSRSQSTSNDNHNEAFTVANENQNLIDANHTVQNSGTFASENPVFSTSDTENNRMDTAETESEPEGVFIPSPDYEEDEKTIEFGDEDPDDSLEEQKINQQNQQHLRQSQNETSLKNYVGEDLSKYLSDDDDEEIFMGNINNNNKTMPVRLSQKHSLFKTNPHNTTGNRKPKGKKKAPAFNSVRNFSLADSKYATSGKAAAKAHNGKSSNDYESFLTTNQNGEGGYETFLRSKHGVGLDSPQTGHIDYHGHHPQWNGKNGHHDGIFKKLTVRIKHKLQRNGYEMNDERF